MILYDYIILGQGIAGSVLSLKLRQQGFHVLVIDSPNPNTSSEIAAGIMNPITGKRMTLSWDAKEFFPSAITFYKDLELELNSQFYFNYPVYRIFSSISEQNDWAAKANDQRFDSFVNKSSLTNLKNANIHNPYGAMRVEGGGRVDVSLFIASTQNVLVAEGLFRKQHIELNEIIKEEEHISVGNYKTKKLVFCTGYDPIFWGFLPFTPMKGEVLEVNVAGIDTDKTLVGGCFFSPIHDGRFYAGATYDWKNFDLEPTQKAKGEILDKVSRFIKTSIQVDKHKVGIRPAVKDRRPLLGEHPDKRNIYLFSGLGSKGVSMAPLLADQLIDFMEQGAPLKQEVSLNRFL